jgi:hypothetical protein
MRLSDVGPFAVMALLRIQTEPRRPELPYPTAANLWYYLFIASVRGGRSVHAAIGYRRDAVERESPGAVMQCIPDKFREFGGMGK